MDKPKFNIGDHIFFVWSSCSYGVKEPCRVCFGKLRVTVILGNGENVESWCDYCAQGIDPPSGYSMTWDAVAKIHDGLITGISRNSDGEWVYEAGYERVKESEVFTSLEAATPAMESKLKEMIDRRESYRRDHFVNATKKQLWNVGYHRERIKGCERTMAWHQMRLCMLKERKP